jgi:hypothetical protein
MVNNFITVRKAVIASGAKQSRVPSAGSLDCRASLAMTALNGKKAGMSR